MRLVFFISILEIIVSIHTHAQTFNLGLQMDSTTIDWGIAIEEAEGGYHLFSAWRYPFGPLNTGMYKLNVFGETIWKKSIGFDTLNIFTGYFGGTVKIDGGYALGTGITTFSDEYFATMVRFDENGDSLFTSTIAVPGEELVGRSIVSTNDGFVMTGFTTENTAGETQKILLVKFSLTGELIWKRKFTASPIHLDGFSLIQPRMVVF
ncbi:MAG: hypothetical protein RL220_1001 [Bacteroidota bacterium]|jgi:hypothetical protein